MQVGFISFLCFCSVVVGFSVEVVVYIYIYCVIRLLYGGGLVCSEFFIMIFFLKSFYVIFCPPKIRCICVTDVLNLNENSHLNRSSSTCMFFRIEARHRRNLLIYYYKCKRLPKACIAHDGQTMLFHYIILL